MAESRVIYTAPALQDLVDIHTHIARDSSQNAAEVARRLVKRIDGLADSIVKHRVVGRSRTHKAPVRLMIEYPFLIYYSTAAPGETHHILAIEHGARKRRTRFE